MHNKLAKQHIAFLVAIILLVAACCQSAWAITLQEEIELGQKLNEEILKQSPLTNDKEALREIEEYGQKLVKNVKRPEIKYHFKIIQEDDLNAFAIPGGYIYFTERLWNVLRKDERIGVLGHEIVHVDRRHALDAISKARRRQIGIFILLTILNANETWSDIADILHTLYSLKYSRADERQADEIGVQLIAQAGYNPAGLLLAMRKINRFQSEHGGQPPKIFSSHPPTPERLRYLESMLKDMGVPVPPETVPYEEGVRRIGEVVAVGNNTVQFTSSKTLAEGDVVWLMTTGWDFYYEKRTVVPAARLVVTRAGSTYTADARTLPGVAWRSITKGIGVYDPPKPSPEVSSVRLEIAPPNIMPRIVSPTPVNRLDRFLARQVVWNKDRTKLIYDNTAYLVVTDSGAPAQYVAAARTAYSYAPLHTGANLQPAKDPDAHRWAGPVVSIGRRGQTIELLTSRDTARLEADMKSGKRFDVVLPPWDPTMSYRQRVVGKAVLTAAGPKIVLRMLSYSPGWNIDGIATGFDIYDSLPEEDASK